MTVLVFIAEKKFGEYTGRLEWCVKDDIWINNCFVNTVFREEEILDIDDRRRAITKDIRPSILVPQPIAGDPPVEGTGLLWYFEPEYLTEEYVFDPPLTAPVVAWAIKVDDFVRIFNAETGTQIGNSRPAPIVRGSASIEYYADDFEMGCWHYAQLAVASGFKRLGFKNSGLVQPSRTQVRDIIKNPDTKYFFCVAHGSYTCALNLYNYTDISEWLQDRPPMWFTFLCHCWAVSNTGQGTLSHGFRKGLTTGTVVVGLKHSIAPSEAWIVSFFNKMVAGATWKGAFDYANAMNLKDSDMFGFSGDPNMRLDGSTEVSPPPPPPPPPEDKITKAGIISELGKRGAINTGLVTTSPGLGKWYYISGVLGYVTRTRTISISNLNARNPPTKTSDIRLVENRTNVNELEKAWVIARLDELPYGAAPPPPPPPPDDEGEIALAVDKTTCGIGEQIKLTGWYKNESGTLVVGHDVGFYSYLNGKRTYIGKTRTSHAGLYTFKYEPGEAGTWQFEAYNDYTSPRVAVEVTGAAPPSGKITKAGIISELGKSGAIDLSKVSTSLGREKWYRFRGRLNYDAAGLNMAISLLNTNARNPPTKTSDISLSENRQSVNELDRTWVQGALAKLPYGAAPPPPPPPPDDEGEIALAVDKTTCGIGEQIKLTGWYKNESGTLVVGHDVGFYSYLNGKRTYIGKTRTSHAGLYTFKYEPGEAGTWQFEAYNDYTSPRVAVEVTGAAPPSGKITKAGIISELGKSGAIDLSKVSTSLGREKWYRFRGRLNYDAAGLNMAISLLNTNARNPPTKTSDISLSENRQSVNELDRTWVQGALAKLPYGAAPPPPPPPPPPEKKKVTFDSTPAGASVSITSI